MRLALLTLLAGLSVAAAAHAETPQDAGSAMGACLAAVIDGAPVADVSIGDVAIHREAAPNSCTVNVRAGDPSAVRAAVLAAVAERHERFAPAATRWDAGEFATREALCDLPSRRPYSVLVSTGRKDGPGLALSATVMDTKKRDDRCDKDLGEQRIPSL
jgi:hypothetical protein